MNPALRYDTMVQCSGVRYSANKSAKKEINDLVVLPWCISVYLSTTKKYHHCCVAVVDYVVYVIIVGVVCAAFSSLQNAETTV